MIEAPVQDDGAPAQPGGAMPLEDFAAEALEEGQTALFWDSAAGGYIRIVRPPSTLFNLRRLAAPSTH